MKRIWLIFRKDTKRRLKSPWGVLILLFIPFFMTFLLGSIFAPGENQDKLPRIKVLLVDKDQDIGAQLFIQSFNQASIKEMFQVVQVTEGEGKKRMSRGQASAMIVIPEKFSENIADSQNSVFWLIKNPAEQFLPRVVEEFMNTEAVIISGFAQVFAGEIRLLRSLLNTPLETISIDAMIPDLEKSKDKITALKSYLDPLLISLKTEVKGKKEEKPGPALNLFAVILPAMSIMFLLFIIQIFLRDIISEREDGTLPRILFSPIGVGEYILARIVSGWFMGILVYLVLIAAGTLLFHIAWGNILYLLIFVAVTCFWIASFFALLNAFFKNRNQAGALSAPIILCFSAFGGSLIPGSQMISVFRLAGYFTPNYWFIQGVDRIGQGAFPTQPALILAVSGLLLFVLAAHILKRRIRV